MARRGDNVRLPSPEAVDLGFRFLQARRAQNLSWMRMVEQAFTSIAEMQKTAGATGAALARLSSSQAKLMRDTASVYRSLTTHLAR